MAIIVPGLGNNKFYKPFLNWWWKRKGVNIVFFDTKWKSKENYQTKLDRLIDLIDKESMSKSVSLVGVSAGGSLVINAYSHRKNNINKVITICSPLRKGKINEWRSFEKTSKVYPTFYESVIMAEENENNFLKEDRQKIMTVHTLFGDEKVPINTTTINQARNIFVPTGGHLISIFSSLTWYSKPLIMFIKENLYF